MTNAYDEKIDNIRADSELARKLVPNKFKFTSQQGRARRQKLLAAAKSLSADRPISEITLADVCEEAGIPRASAYHFFPNVDAVFLALRYLNSTEIFKTLATVSAADTQGWQAYITNYIYTYVDVLRDDNTVARLVYETNTPAFENNEFGSEANEQASRLLYDQLAAYYQMPDFADIQCPLKVVYGIINGVFTLAYRAQQTISDVYREEATKAAIAYLSLYLPEELARKPQ